MWTYAVKDVVQWGKIIPLKIFQGDISSVFYPSYSDHHFGQLGQIWTYRIMVKIFLLGWILRIFKVSVLSLKCYFWEKKIIQMLTRVNFRIFTNSTCIYEFLWSSENGHFDDGFLREKCRMNSSESGSSS